MNDSDLMVSATRSEAALAAVLSGNVEIAAVIVSGMPLQDEYDLRKAAETLSALCKKPPVAGEGAQSGLCHSAAREQQLITVPEVTLPNGTTVPSFQVSQYHWSRSDDGTPWVNIGYHDARKACQEAGMSLITELQALAIAHDIVQQDINWTGGKVGLGKVFQGLHKGRVEGPREREFVSPDPEERRWHQLSNGSRIYDFAGHVYSWVFDDVQGDVSGILAKDFGVDSPSISIPTGLGLNQGIGLGWSPLKDYLWAGRALIRGGYWCSGRDAGVFRLNFGHPDRGWGDVGFRCTKF
jgi:hypothetical protein